MSDHNEPYLNKDFYDFGNEASPIAFGWNFQYSAGIFLFAKNANRIKSIVIESKNQDIEISTIDDEAIYAQAKSSQEPLSCSPEVKENKIIDAIISLAKTYSNHGGDKNSFIYITNVDGTFERDEAVFDNMVIKYKNLDPFFKNQIDALFSKAKDGVEKKKKLATRNKNKYDVVLSALEDFDKNKLSISVIKRFYGSDERYVSINNEVAKLLVKGFRENPTTAEICAEELVGYLRNVFEDSATISSKNPNKELRIEDLVWPIAVITGNNQLGGVSFEEDCFDAYPEHDVVERGQKFVNSRKLLYIERFEVSNKIINDYDAFRRANPNDSKKLEHFVKEKAMGFENLLLIPKDLDDETREYVVKRLVAQVIHNQNKIVNVTNWLNTRGNNDNK